ncbi:putative restriction endonuclease [Motilibacter peucedani]|uniref:Putative restriction endonuclease n=2 Tax=Motilibacter peucedani TaxID=598650 RepID=A0A420XRP7_9ACTN|nr:putative restriction endonuclease [Motilibacter peucedani]
MDWLRVRTNDGLDTITFEELREFEYGGGRVPLMDAQRGIRKPQSLGAALSIRTVYRREGAERPYEDGLRPDGLIDYKWRGDDGNHSENRALRAAMEQHLPLIWFVGIAPGVYQAAFPVYFVAEEPEKQQFVVSPERDIRLGGSPVEEHLKRYLLRETKQRLHQPVFRATVMRAYETRCAVCALRHAQLLDAAHIVPDSDESGIASVRNGLALCKIHHAAYDSHILGIRPDHVVEIRADLLDEVDGPMLQHGLKERHGQPLMKVPSVRRERPDRELLEIGYRRFLSAS